MRDTDDLGNSILRVTLAILILFHGISKVFNGPGFMVGLVSNAGLPPAVRYPVYAGEVLAPLMMLFCIWARVGALIVVMNMLFAFVLVQSKQIMTLSSVGGWGTGAARIVLVPAVAVLLLGAGRISIGGSKGHWN